MEPASRAEDERTGERLPTAEEINPTPGCLDEECACRNFLGRTRREAEELFRDNLLHYSEDLLWMGPRAFEFYVRAAIDYLKSEHARGDCDGVSAFHGTIELRARHDDLPAIPALIEALGYIIREFDRFGASIDIYGHLRAEYRALLEWLRAKQAPPGSAP